MVYVPSPPHVLLYAVEDLRLLLGELYPLVEAEVYSYAERYPPALRLAVERLGVRLEGPFAPLWRRFLTTRDAGVAPLVKFTPRGTPREVEGGVRCGPAVLLLDEGIFPRVFTTRCGLLSRVFKMPRGQRYPYSPREALCPAVESLAERLGASDPWEAAALYYREGGKRRYLQGLAAFIYWCRTGRTPEGDYLLGRLSGVTAEEIERRLRPYSLQMKSGAATSPLHKSRSRAAYALQNPSGGSIQPAPTTLPTYSGGAGHALPKQRGGGGGALHSERGALHEVC
ncbi:MAG: hypothetical protein ACPL3C_13230 [Pyrobaculum sp.]